MFELENKLLYQHKSQSVNDQQEILKIIGLMFKFIELATERDVAIKIDGVDVSQSYLHK